MNMSTSNPHVSHISSSKSRDSENFLIMTKKPALELNKYYPNVRALIKMIVGIGKNFPEKKFLKYYYRKGFMEWHFRIPRKKSCSPD